MCSPILIYIRWILQCGKKKLGLTLYVYSQCIDKKKTKTKHENNTFCVYTILEAISWAPHFEWWFFADFMKEFGLFFLWQRNFSRDKKWLIFCWQVVFSSSDISHLNVGTEFENQKYDAITSYDISKLSPEIAKKLSTLLVYSFFSFFFVVNARPLFFIHLEQFEMPI